MADLIHKEDALKVIEAHGIQHSSMYREIANIATIEAEPVRHGRWVAETERMGTYSHCSECGCRCQGYTPNYNYCPNCGADMRGE